MKRSALDVTLQINVCAGDIDYCDPIVRALIASHRTDVREVVVVMDLCRPQATPVVHRPSRFPRAAFHQRLAQLKLHCDRWLAEGLVDRVVPLHDDPGELRRLNWKYSGVDSPVSHDHLGHASAAYYLGWDSANTRYVLHFDGDIIFFQATGHSWLAQAVASLERNPQLIAVSPRICPPLSGSEKDPLVDLQQMPRCGWASSWSLDPVEEGWTSPWISTRCHLIDRERMQKVLPFTPTRGRAAYTSARRINAWLSPLFNLRIWTLPVPHRGFGNILMRAVHKLRLKIPEFPLPPEVLINENNQTRQIKVLYLKDLRAWFVHPATKPPIFYQLLPRLLDSVAHGRHPATQQGMCDLDYPEWDAFFAESR